MLDKPVGPRSRLLDCSLTWPYCRRPLYIAPLRQARNTQYHRPDDDKDRDPSHETLTQAVGHPLHELPPDATYATVAELRLPRARILTRSTRSPGPIPPRRHNDNSVAVSCLPHYTRSPRQGRLTYKKACSPFTRHDTQAGSLTPRQGQLRTEPNASPLTAAPWQHPIPQARRRQGPGSKPRIPTASRRPPSP